MALAFDATTENIAAADPQNFTHTPVGTPRAVVVLIAHGTTSTDIVSSVSYGGKAMTRIQTNTDTSTEPGRSYVYFLGSQIPTGAQTVSIDRTEATTSVFAVAATFTSTIPADTGDIDRDGINENAANPQVTLQFGGRSAISVCVCYSGLGTVGSLTDLSDQTRLHDHDFGAFVAVASRLTNPQTADDTIGYTSGSDDVAFSAIAFAELVISPTGIGTGGAFGTPTVLRGSVTVSPSSIGTGEALGAPTVTPGPVTVSPSGIGSGQAFGTPTLTVGPVTVTPSGIGSAQAFGTATITTGPVTVSPTGIASGQAFGTPTVTVIGGSQTVGPVGIASAAAFGTPAVFAFGLLPFTLPAERLLHMSFGRPYQQGEVGEELRLFLGSGKASGSTVVAFLKKPDGSVTAPLTVTSVSDVAGIFRYTFVAGDLAQVGVHIAYLRESIGGNVFFGFPVRFQVLAPDDPLNL